MLCAKIVSLSGAGTVWTDNCAGRAEDKLGLNDKVSAKKKKLKCDIQAG